MTWNNTRYKYAIGIDCGKKTGIAIWNCTARQWVEIKTVQIDEAWEIVQDYASGHDIEVVVEDARQATFGRQNDIHKAQGAGSVKRDAVIWQDYLTRKKIPFRMVRPAKSKTKLDKQAFINLTKYTGLTSNHSRDAAMLVWGR